MFSLAPMFGMVDGKTMQDTIMENESYLEKIIEKLPYIGEDYKKEREKEKARREAGYPDLDEEEENKNEDGVEKIEADPDNESYMEKIKKGISAYWASWFETKNAPEKIFPEDKNYVSVNINTPNPTPLTTPMSVSGNKAVAV